MNRPHKAFWVSTLAAAGVIVAGFIGWLIGAHFNAAAATAQAEPVLWQAPDYHLTNQLGRSVDSSQFQGKVQVVTFLFPYCTTYCPLIAAHLVGFENILRSADLQDRVELVAFNVDPAGTGPEQMRGFLQEYGWNPHDPHWQYLTGDPHTIRHVITDGFHVAYQKTRTDQPAQGPELTPQPQVVNALAQKADVDYDVTHNDALIIVDPEGRVRRIYDQADTVSTRELLHAVRALTHGDASPGTS